MSTPLADKCITVDIRVAALAYALEGHEWPSLAALFVEIATGGLPYYDEHVEKDLELLGDFMVHAYRVRWGQPTVDPSEVALHDQV